jgi:hypothetical protein
MNMNEIVRHRTSDHVADQMSRYRNILGIKKVDRVYDKNKDELILLVNTREMLDAEVSACLKGNLLILEAPIQLDYNKPYHTKLAGGDPLRDSEIDLSLIGFSEVKLKPGYHYSLISCQLINPTLVKIILNSKISLVNSFHFTYKKNKRRK